MRKLRVDAYLVRELGRAVGLGILIALPVLLALQALRLANVMIGADLSFGFVLRIFGAMGLSFLPVLFPIAFLFGMLAVYGRMSTDREFVAMQAMGLSPQRLLLPGWLFGAAMAVLTFFFCFSIGPQGNERFEQLMNEAFRSRMTSALRAGTFTENFLDLVVFVENVDPINQELSRVFIFDDTNYTEPAAISALKGKWLQEGEGGAGAERVGVLRLSDGVTISTSVSDSKKESVRRVRFDEYKLFADFSRQAGWARAAPPSWNLSELSRRRVEAMAGQADPRPVWVEIARRVAIVFLCIIVVPVCFFLSLDNRRTAKSRAVFTGLIILLCYWTVYFALVTWLVKTPIEFFQRHEWANWLVIWIPNIALGLLGFWQYRKRTGLLS